MDVSEANAECDRVLDEIGSAVIADREFLETVLLGFVGRGHVLMEDVPGTGKTLTARSMATALGLDFSRVQFTPDLLPADITGTHVFNEREREFEFNEGPLFANVVLADEINRAPPKTQSALLEAMEEEQVTVDGDTYELPSPFFVLATQNPVEMEGTFELPEAQVDRFLVKSSIGYPDEAGEEELLHRRLGRSEQSPSVSPVLNQELVTDLREAPEQVRVDDDLVTYVSAIARATRQDRRVEVGVSPRGTQRLLEATRARAAMVGREYVTPDDVKRVAQPVLAHRVVLTPDARVDEVQKSTVVDAVLDEVPVPTV
ncbi:methanol dehydrogenase regulatory protein [Halosimplex carlsbadense 2-9-1]|uniref:Methanol dehydrogenase regulatory protein n=1 Tax=Halosimplex carlsbadense 2-9-1 TaxID=797114 RepID=M0CAR3_9EURY|nr:MoxR family ATPase [Halosimplex carlsbadense]ELZ20330.1 methanol dehydrogenase regulatory protein [Halosimplex carlsbadense 2-9-1]